MVNIMVYELSRIIDNSLSIMLNPDTLRYIIGAVVILLFFLLLRKIFTRYIFHWILKFMVKTDIQLMENMLKAFERPLRTLFIILGIYFALKFLPLSLSQDQSVSKIFRSAIIVLISWGLYDLCASRAILSEEIQRRLNVDKILLPFFSKIIRFIIIAMALVIVAHEWDYDVNGFIAGLGLGGLAFALAAQDALSNIVGGMVIILEKPFSIGDWIVTPSVEGVVEDITFRSTKVRAFSHSLITVPNSTLANESITNYSQMGKRQITFDLKMTYDTPRDKIDKCVTRIREMLSAHPGIHPETILVYFDTFSTSSLNIFLYFFTNTTVWQEFLEVKQDVNFRIMGIMEEEGIKVALPSRDIYFKNAPVVKETTADTNDE